MKLLRLGAAFALAAAVTAGTALADGDLYIVGVDPLVVQNAGGCKKIDTAVLQCSFAHGGYTYVYFGAKKPTFIHCSISVSRGPGPKWHVDASPCVAKWNGTRVYISKPKD